MSTTPEGSAKLKLGTPSIPRPPDAAALSTAIECACLRFGDILVGFSVEALIAVEVVRANGHSLRYAAWAVWELVELDALRVHPRPNIDVVREFAGCTFELIDDPRPRYWDGRLIPDGPFPVPDSLQLPWYAALLEPNHARLDEIHLGLQRSPDALPQAHKPPEDLLQKEVASLDEVEAQTPPLDAASSDWLTPAEVKKLDRTDVDSLRVLRSTGRRNAEKIFGVDKSGRRWRKPTANSRKVYYWKPYLLSQRREE